MSISKDCNPRLDPSVYASMPREVGKVAGALTCPKHPINNGCQTSQCLENGGLFSSMYLDKENGGMGRQAGRVPPLSMFPHCWEQRNKEDRSCPSGIASAALPTPPTLFPYTCPRQRAQTLQSPCLLRDTYHCMYPVLPCLLTTGKYTLRQWTE